MVIKSPFIYQEWRLDKIGEKHGTENAEVEAIRRTYLVSS